MLKLPKMNNLSPTLDSTILKLVEEAGELARAVLKFHKAEEEVSRRLLLSDVVGELIDVAQTCVTMLFVLEEFYEINIDYIVEKHLSKLVQKGYIYDISLQYGVTTKCEYKCLEFPRLLISTDVIQTLCKIQEELGELTQFIGKRGGASGEKNKLTHRQIIAGAARELCDVAQCCFTMLYILKDTQCIDVEIAQAMHIEKLQKKGYLKLEQESAND